MIIDDIKNCSDYYLFHESFKLAFDFLLNRNLDEIEDGKVDLLGERVFAIISSIDGQEKSSNFEVHNEYIDIHYVIKGVDRMGYKLRTDCSHPRGEFDLKNDYLLYDDEVNNIINLKKDSFAICFPKDAHAPVFKVRNLKKVVLKIKV